MQITFDPTDEKERQTVSALIHTLSGEVEPASFQAPAPVQTETATVTVNADTPVGGVPTEQDDGNPDPNSPDKHGMVWNEEIHSNPPALNADGSWRARRGKKDEYEAAIAAHKAATAANAGQTMTEAPMPQPAPVPVPVPEQAPAGTAMPMPGMPPAPAAPAPQTPAAPIAYEDMAKRFVGMMESDAITDYAQVYADLQIDHGQVEQNQTMIARLWKYMDALAAGLDHANAAASANAD